MPFSFAFFRSLLAALLLDVEKGSHPDFVRLLFKKTDLAFNILFIFRCHHFQLNSIFTGSHPGSGNKRRPEITGSVFGFRNIDQRQWCAALLLLQDIACKKPRNIRKPITPIAIHFLYFFMICLLFHGNHIHRNYNRSSGSFSLLTAVCNAVIHSVIQLKSFLTL